MGDIGIGIRRHLANNPRYANLRDDAAAIKEAIKPGVSGTSEYRGYGFEEIQEQAERVGRATLLIRSGTGRGQIGRFAKIMEACILFIVFSERDEKGVGAMRYELSQHGVVFSTRERGAEVRADIEAAMRQADPSEPLVLDFADVELVSFSFADEVVGRLLSEVSAGSGGERTILLARLNEEVQYPVERSLNRRNLIAGYLEDGYVRLLGAPIHLQETFDAALARGEFRATGLAAELGISAPACNNRLKPLAAAGLLTRVQQSPRSGGREFVYRLPPSLGRARPLTTAAR